MKPNLLNKYSNRNHTFDIVKSKPVKIKNNNASINQNKQKKPNPNNLPIDILNKQNALRQATYK
jgi:hypothetical protein